VFRPDEPFYAKLVPKGLGQIAGQASRLWSGSLLSFGTRDLDLTSEVTLPDNWLNVLKARDLRSR
jgi:hypothetical protein